MSSDQPQPNRVENDTHGGDASFADRTTWQIWIAGYGQFEFEGTEAEAEEMRVHKARWEGGQGRKWRADLARESDRLTAEIVELWATGNGAPISLLRDLSRARDDESGLTDEGVYRALLGRGYWCRARLLASKVGLSLRGTKAALHRLKKAGRVETGGPDWRCVAAGAGNGTASTPDASRAPGTNP